MHGIGQAKHDSGGDAYLVEDMVVTLGVIDSHHSATLQQIGTNGSATDDTLLVEVDLNVFTEPTTVAVTNGLCVTKSLKQRIGLQHLFACR